MKKLVVGICLLILSLGLVACGGNTDSNDAGGGSSDFKVGMALTGPKTDGGWNQSAFAGLEKIQTELGAEILYNENTQPSDYEKILRDYAKQDCDLIIGHGYQFVDAGKVVAEEFPDVKFVITSTEISNGSNLASIWMNYYQEGFLQGSFAALMTESKILGSIGGQDIPPIKNTLQGFEGGAKYINPEVKVLSAYTGDFDDASKVKEQALSMIGQGSDLVMVSANNAGRGAYEAAKDKGKYAIASIGAEFEKYTEALIACGEADMATAIFQVAQEAKDGTFEGKNYLKGVVDGVVRLTYNPALEDKIPAEVKEKMDKITAEIKDGTLDVEKYITK